MQSGFVAAIDLGTSKIRGVIGRKNENGVISITAYQEVLSNNCIRRGIVHNVEETGSNVRKLIDLLENKTGKKITRAYVSLSGQSLYCTNTREVKQLPQTGIVTEEIVSQLRANAEKFKPDFKQMYTIADVEYFVDEKPEKNPVGVTCSLIEADYKAIVGRPNLFTNIKNAIEKKSNLEIVDFIVGPLATASATLTDEEKELGCAFIDFGAGTTSLSIYKGNILRYMVVIPFGGHNITKDICELNFTEADAEQYKTKFGKAKDAKDSNATSSFFTSPFTSPFSTKPDINMEELNKVITLRLDEITANINEQIDQSGYKGQLGAGLIITGGASQLKHLDIYLEEKLDMKVRKATAKKTIVNNYSELTNDPSYTQMLGLLMFADEDCEHIYIDDLEEKKEKREEEKDDNSKRGKKSFSDLRNLVNKKNEKKEEKIKKSGSLGSKMGDFFSGFFTEDDDE